MARVSVVKEDGQEEYKLILYEIRLMSGCLFVYVNLPVCQPQIQHYVGPMHLILQVQVKKFTICAFLVNTSVIDLDFWFNITFNKLVYSFIYLFTCTQYIIGVQ